MAKQKEPGKMGFDFIITEDSTNNIRNLGDKLSTSLLHTEKL